MDQNSELFVFKSSNSNAEALRDHTNNMLRKAADEQRKKPAFSDLFKNSKITMKKSEPSIKSLLLHKAHIKINEILDSVNIDFTEENDEELQRMAGRLNVLLENELEIAKEDQQKAKNTKKAIRKIHVPEYEVTRNITYCVTCVGSEGNVWPCSTIKTLG